MAKKGTPGKKYPLVMYTRTINRAWGITLMFGLVLFALWWFGSSFTALFREEISWLFLAAAVIVIAIGIFLFIGRKMVYVRVGADHFLVSSPLLRFKTSFRRIISISSSELRQLFDYESLSWSQQQFIGPFLNETVIVVRLRGYPLSPAILQLFFQKFILSPKSTGLVLLVPNWMDFSLELDAQLNSWRQARKDRQRRQKGFQQGMYK